MGALIKLVFSADFEGRLNVRCSIQKVSTHKVETFFIGLVLD